MDLYEIRKKAKEKKEAEEAEAKAAEAAKASEEASGEDAGSAEEPAEKASPSAGPKPKKPRKKAGGGKPSRTGAEEAESGPAPEPDLEEVPEEVPEDFPSEEPDVPLDELMQRAFEAEVAAASEEPPAAAPEEPAAVPEPEPAAVAAPAEKKATGEAGSAVPAAGHVVGEDDEDAEEDNIIEYLAFRLSDEEYAIRVADIKEIIRPQKITMVPRAPEFVEGIFSLRGVIIPVFDIKKRLGFPNVERERTTRILIVSDGGAAQGIIVDRVTGVARLKADSIEPPPTVIGGVEAEYLEGIGRLDGRLLILFNTASVLSMEG